MSDGFRLHSTAGGKYRTTRRRTTNPVHTVTVDRRIWQAALDLADGDVTRIEVISATEVVVTNDSTK